MTNRLSESQYRMEDDRRVWTQKETNYINEIEKLKLQLSQGGASQRQDQYYLRV